EAAGSAAPAAKCRNCRREFVIYPLLDHAHCASRNGGVWDVVGSVHSGLMPANFITLAHFSVSSAMNLPKSAGEPTIIVPPRSASFASSLASARPALTSLLSLSMISGGVFLGAPMPNHALAS